MVHHRRGLRQLLKNDALVVAVENDWTTAALGDKRRAMLAFAVKLTITPGAITPDDAQALRDADFSDRDILDIT
ncbi:MAG: peroxidase-related enzyme, partial [Acidimicrobiales bacterium]